VLFPFSGVVAALFSHEVGGSLDNRPADGKRGCNTGGVTTIICSSAPSSRCSNSDSRRAPELYDLDSGCRWWLIELIVLTDEADDRCDRLSIDRRRVSEDGASSSSLHETILPVAPS
jgi:hypothetical protein